LDDIQRRHDKAMHYFELAASENDWQAIFQLGVMYFDGIECEPDMVRIFCIWYVCVFLFHKCNEQCSWIRRRIGKTAESTSLFFTIIVIKNVLIGVMLSWICRRVTM